MPPAKNERLNHTPLKAETALLLIDVINDLEFDGGEKLLVQALPMAVSLAALKRRAKIAGIPVIYVNDNFGRWRSDFSKLVRHCIGTKCAGPPCRGLVDARRGRLLYSETKTLGFFPDQSRDPTELLGHNDTYFDRYGNRYLRTF